MRRRNKQMVTIHWADGALDEFEIKRAYSGIYMSGDEGGNIVGFDLELPVARPASIPGQEPHLKVTTYADNLWRNAQNTLATGRPRRKRSRKGGTDASQSSL